MKVATFFHGNAEDPKISKVMAYTSWYNPSWEGCVVYDVQAKNGTEAKRVAREMRLAALKSAKIEASQERWTKGLKER